MYTSIDMIDVSGMNVIWYKSQILLVRMVYFTENKSEVASVKFLATARSVMILKLYRNENLAQ